MRASAHATLVHVKHFGEQVQGRFGLISKVLRNIGLWDRFAARYLLSGDGYDKELASLVDIDYLYLSGISLAILPRHDRQKLIDGLVRAKEQGSQIWFDSNYRHKLWASNDEAQQWYRKIIRITDIAFLTFDDECQLWGDSSPEDVFARCRFYGIPEVVLKRGEESCLIEANGKTYAVKAISIPSEKVIDTTAAGDSFNAGYLASRLRGEVLPSECAAVGHCLSSKVIQHRGAIIPRKLV